MVIFRLTESYGSVERYKARLLAQGYKAEIFAPAAKMTTIQVLLAISAIKQ